MTPHPTASPRTGREVPQRGRMLLLGLAIPAVVAAVVFVILRSWIPDLPDPMAVHWSPDGADGFASPAAMTWCAFIVVPAAGICAALGWFWGQDAFTRRMALATSWFLTVFLSGLFLGLAASQRGLADAHDVADADPRILVALAVAALAGVGGWFAMPGDPPADDAGGLDPSTRHLAVSSGERVVWTRTVRQRGLIPILAAVGVVALGVVIAFGGTTGLLVIGCLFPLLFLLVWLFSSARVLVDGSGLTVTLGPGIRLRRISAQDIESVDVADVHPMRQFGGYGVRTGRQGVVGVVMRSGPGIWVTTGGGRRFVVAVPDAATGAALLAGVALRAQGKGRPR